MQEQLIIRLPEHEQQPIHWFIWRAADNDVIASGELENAAQLSHLQGHAEQREVSVFVASQAILLSRVELPSGGQRHLAQLVPYALEEELAADIEQLHFAWPQGRLPSPLPVAVVEHRVLQQWREWLTQAGISAQRLSPDVFMLPPPAAEQWHVMQVGQDVIVRSGRWQGFCIDSDLFQNLASSLVADQAPPQQIVHYGDIDWPQPPAPLQAADIELPLSAAAKAGDGINLLQGEYRPQQHKRQRLLPVKALVASLLVALSLALATQISDLYRTQAYADQLQAKIEQTYRQTFPGDSRIINVRVQMQQKLAQLAGGPSAAGDPLLLLSQLQPAFAAIDGARLESLRFEKGELRLQATTESFQQFEQLQQLAQQAGLTVKTGQQTNRNDRVMGNLTVTAAGS